MRSELIARRMAIPPDARRDWSLRISLALLHALPVRSGTIIGFCWPYKGEYDPRPMLRSLRSQGVLNALPVIRHESEPMKFRRWAPGVAMTKGPYGISMPAGTEEVDPDLLLIPVVGFGETGDRLGYGGGYFDRSLAARVPQPLSIGVGFEIARMATTFPRSHDIPMDAVVTESASRWRENGRLHPISPALLRSHLAELGDERRAQARANTTTILHFGE